MNNQTSLAKLGEQLGIEAEELNKGKYTHNNFPASIPKNGIGFKFVYINIPTKYVEIFEKPFAENLVDSLEVKNE